MRVHMLATAAGPYGVFLAGQVYDLADQLAMLYVSGGYAQAVPVSPGDSAESTPPTDSAESTPPETATAEPPEAHEKPTRRRRKRSS